MIPETITRTTCRLCGEGPLNTLINFGNLYISNFVSKKDDGIKAPLELALCEKCELLQLKHTAPMELMYSGHYWYQSKLNPVIVEDLREIARIAVSYMDAGDVILDIGANDGTLLSFIGNVYFKLGVEPATNLIKELSKNIGENGATTTSFWEEVNDLPEGKKAKVITAIGMFYDSEDPKKFVKNVTKHLADDGVFITQLMTLAPMINMSDLGNVCHEHLEYYSYKTLVYLFEESGLEIFKVEENSINGGSYRLFARKYKNGSIEYKEPEFDYQEFADDVKRNRDLTVDFIRQEVTKGKKVYGYGASTKGNTMLQYYGLTTNEIEGVIDPHPEKIGKLCVGSGIPVVGEEHLEKADYLFILPWAFTEQFVQKERARGYKGKFIVSIPEFKVL